MIGFVGQEPVLFSSSIRENLAYGRHDEPATEAEFVHRHRAHVSEFIERFSDGWVAGVVNEVSSWGTKNFPLAILRYCAMQKTDN